MKEAFLDTNKKTNSEHHNFHAVYMLTEKYKKREDPNYKSPH